MRRSLSLRGILDRPSGWGFFLVLVLAGFEAGEHLLGGSPDLWWLWLVPLTVASEILGWKWTLAFAVIGAALANAGLPLDSHRFMARFPIMLAVFGGTSVALGEALRKDGRTAEGLGLGPATAALRARQDENARLNALFTSAGVGALTVSAGGKILTANDAAHEILGVEDGTLPGHSVTSYFPPLGNLLYDLHREPTRVRSAMECRVWRRGGKIFEAQVCFATYEGPSGTELGVFFQDSAVWGPEGLDGESNFERLAASVDLHEIRNLSVAIAALCRDAVCGPAGDRQSVLQTIEHLARGLGRVCSRELRPQADGVDRVIFDDFAADLERVLQRALSGSGIRLVWTVPRGLPAVWANAESLLQVFLNLANNSVRALAETSGTKEVSVSADQEGGRVLVCFSDSGTGPEDRGQLFRPVIDGPDVIRVGLCIARSVLRTFGGDLRYKPDQGHSRFVVELLTEDQAERIGRMGAATA